MTGVRGDSADRAGGPLLGFGPGDPRFGPQGIVGGAYLATYTIAPPFWDQAFRSIPGVGIRKHAVETSQTSPVILRSPSDRTVRCIHAGMLQFAAPSLWSLASVSQHSRASPKLPELGAIDVSHCSASVIV